MKRTHPKTSKTNKRPNSSVVATFPPNCGVRHIVTDCPLPNVAATEECGRLSPRPLSPAARTPEQRNRLVKALIMFADRGWGAGAGGVSNSKA